MLPNDPGHNILPKAPPTTPITQINPTHKSSAIKTPREKSRSSLHFSPENSEYCGLSIVTKSLGEFSGGAKNTGCFSFSAVFPVEGESDRRPLRPVFDRRLKLEFHGSRVTSDAGLLAYRELDDALGLTALAAEVLADRRTGKNGWHGVVGLLRQSIFGRLAGYEDVNDADRLGRDPAMRWIVGGKAVERGGASTSQMGGSRPSCWRSTRTSLPSLICRASGSTGFMTTIRRSSSCSTWIAPSARPTVSRRVPRTTATSAAPVITRCSCSTSSGTWSVASFVTATCTAPTNGAMCWSPLSLDTGIGRAGATSEVMLRLHCPGCTSSSNPGASATPSGFPPTRCCRRASPIF